MGARFYLRVPSSPSLFLQRRRATSNFRQPRCRGLAVRSGSAVIAEVAAAGYVPISGTTGSSVPASTRRSARNAQRGRTVVTGDWRLSDRIHAAKASVYGGAFPLEAEINRGLTDT